MRLVPTAGLWCTGPGVSRRDLTSALEDRYAVRSRSKKLAIAASTDEAAFLCGDTLVWTVTATEALDPSLSAVSLMKAYIL